jgi:hypothetical protein
MPPKAPVARALRARAAGSDLRTPRRRSAPPLRRATPCLRLRRLENRLVAARASNGRRGSRTPKAARPTRFRDGVPRRWQSFRMVPAGIRTRTAPIKSRRLCPLSYGTSAKRSSARRTGGGGLGEPGGSPSYAHNASTWPAGIEPATRRASSDRSTNLSYDHMRWARVDSNHHLLVCKTSTLPLSYSPMRFRDKESNPDLHVQSVASCRLDDPGMKSCVCLARPKPNDVFHASRLPFDPGSPSAGCAAGAADVLRGGVLEPEPRSSAGKSQAKADAAFQRSFPAPSAEGLSLSGGASIRSSASSS